jgi:hypothetical protein
MGNLSGVVTHLQKKTAKSTGGNPTVYCRARGFGKPKLERAAYIVSVGSKADQLSAKEAMGAGPE